jgi:murein DD-endopeptidase MepM/ murein hydrolase activator NlpD
MRRFGSILFLAVLLAGCGGPQAPAPVRHYGPGGGAGVAGIHTVRPGDTLWSIAQRYRLDMADVVHANALSAPFVLEPGARLALPPPRTYTVRAGDTLYHIARVTGVPQSAIARQNALAPPYTIQPGQVLRLPSAAGGDGPPPAAAPQLRTVPAALTPPPRAGDGRFARPVAGGRVVSSYGPKAGGLHNDGVDIAAPRGTPVTAAQDGVVAYAGDDLKGYGNLVLVRHEGGWVTAYAHLDSVAVGEGQRVARGAPLGAVGSTGTVDAPQLHFEVRQGTRALDPAKYL